LFAKQGSPDAAGWVFALARSLVGHLLLLDVRQRQCLLFVPDCAWRSISAEGNVASSELINIDQTLFCSSRQNGAAGSSGFQTPPKCHSGDRPIF
jgi:hypothetical protein